MAISNMHPQFKEKLVAQEYGDLYQLASKTNRMEQFIHKKKLKRANKGWRSYVILLFNIDDENNKGFEEEAEILRGKPYSCPRQGHC